MRSIRITTISILVVGLLAGSAVGVAAQSAAVTGSTSLGEDCEGTPEGGMSCVGGRFEFDDPRLSGDYETTMTIASGFATGAEGEIITEEFRVTNDQGAWSGQAILGFLFHEDGESDAPPDGEIDPVAAGAAATPASELLTGGNNMLLTGEGAYAGLVAWVYEPYGEDAVAQGLIIDSRPTE